MCRLPFAILEGHATVQHRARRHAPGRHRAPRTPAGPLILGGRGRSAVLTAAVIAGVGVAGVSAAAASATPAPKVAKPTPAAMHSDLVAPEPDVDDVPATQGLADRSPVPAGAGTPSLSAARVQRKTRPVPVARWVNPLPEASVTSCFGLRWGRLHAGVDLAAPDGTPIAAAGAGVVVAAGPAEGYGNAVLIDHGNGYLTHYGHMSAITVTVGQTVAAGQQIGNEGSTGHSTGPHLHFEVHAGTYKNPIEPTQWMHEHGVDIPGCVSFTG
jgi:murein DD-endopeptidase MepM/ murein hydrolase activator NlpD